MDIEKTPVARAALTPRMNWIYVIGLILLVLILGAIFAYVAT